VLFLLRFFFIVAKKVRTRSMDNIVIIDREDGIDQRSINILLVGSKWVGKRRYLA
jgi:hypothetical protein